MQTEREQNERTRHVIRTALDDLAQEVFLSYVPCEICGHCDDTLSPCRSCFLSQGVNECG